MSYLTEQISCQIRIAPDTTRHRRFTVQKWRTAVRKHETVLGYKEWLSVMVVGEFAEMIIDLPYAAAPAPSMPPKPSV